MAGFGFRRFAGPFVAMTEDATEVATLRRSLLGTHVLRWLPWPSATPAPVAVAASPTGCGGAGRKAMTARACAHNCPHGRSCVAFLCRGVAWQPGHARARPLLPCLCGSGAGRARAALHAAELSGGGDAG